MKKILIIPSWYPNKDNPGLGNFFHEQAALFEDEYDVRIFAGYLNRNIARFIKLKNTGCFALKKQLNNKAKNDYFLSPPYVYGFEYQQGINKWPKINFQMTIQAYLNYFEHHILPDWKPDLIHAQNTKMAGILARYISDKFHIPYIITDHHHVNPKVPAFIQEEIRLAMLHAKTNCFVSEWQYRTYLLLDSHIKGTVVGNPVDSDLFQPVNKNTDNFVITHASNADTPKDIETLITTIDKFFKRVESCNNITVNIIGFPDSIIHEWHTRADINEWFKRIKFYPQLPKTEYVKILQQSDIFLMTSIYESFGLAPLEAMLCGVPAICTNNGGVDEYLVDGVNGIKVPLKDAEGLAQRLLAIYEQKTTFNPEKVRESVLGKFNREAFRQRMVSVYNESI